MTKNKKNKTKQNKPTKKKCKITNKHNNYISLFSLNKEKSEKIMTIKKNITNKIYNN